MGVRGQWVSLLESIAAVLVDGGSLVQQNGDVSGRFIVDRGGEGTADQGTQHHTHDLGCGVHQVSRESESECVKVNVRESVSLCESESDCERQRVCVCIRVSVRM